MGYLDFLHSQSKINRIKHMMFVNENIDDFLKPKDVEKISSDFMSKYGIKYYDLKETIERLKRFGVNVFLETDSETERKPITLQGINIQRASKGSGMSWGLITVVNDDYANKIIEALERYGDFWKQGEIYKKETDSLSSRTYITHVEALKILHQLENES